MPLVFGSAFAYDKRMKNVLVRYRRMVLVCVNERRPGVECCAANGSMELYEKLKETMKAADPSVRVSRTGCMGCCATGPTVVIQPDNRWFGDVRLGDIDEIVRIATADNDDTLTF